MERGEPKGSLFVCCPFWYASGEMGKRRDKNAQNATIVQDFAEICCYTMRKTKGESRWQVL